IVVLRSSQQYLLLANQRPTDVDRSFTATPLSAGGVQGQPIHGHVLALDRQTGRLLWPTAAFVSQHALSADQPNESPLLFFVRKVIMTRPGATVTRNSTSVLAIDKRDGRIVYSDDGFLAEAAQSDVVADPIKNSVSLTVTASRARRTVMIELPGKRGAPERHAHRAVG